MSGQGEDGGDKPNEDANVVVVDPPVVVQQEGVSQAPEGGAPVGIPPAGAGMQPPVADPQQFAQAPNMVNPMQPYAPQQMQYAQQQPGYQQPVPAQPGYNQYAQQYAQNQAQQQMIPPGGQPGFQPPLSQSVPMQPSNPMQFQQQQLGGQVPLVQSVPGQQPPPYPQQPMMMPGQPMMVPGQPMPFQPQPMPGQPGYEQWKAQQQQFQQAQQPDNNALGSNAVKVDEDDVSLILSDDDYARVAGQESFCDKVVDLIGTTCCQVCCFICCIACCIILIIWFAIWCDSDRLRAVYNRENGRITDDMSRVAITPAPGYQYRLQKYGIQYGTEPALEWQFCEWDSYWNERGKVDISAKAEAQVMEATFELHNMALEAVDTIVKDDVLLSLFYINRDLWPAIRESWDKGKVDFQGRFDFAWDGKNPPKLLEYNADTPSLQIESSVAEDDWFRVKYLDNGRNNLHMANYMDLAVNESLKQVMDFCRTPKERVDMVGHQSTLQDMALTYIGGDDEGMAVMRFFEKRIKQFSRKVSLFDIDSLQQKYGFTFGHVAKNFWYKTSSVGWGNSEQEVYNCLFSLYPKEWMISEIQNYPMKKYDFEDLNSIEPWWKLILGNKALLPFLWSMYPNHPNLVPAYYDDPRKELGDSGFEKLHIDNWVSKPIFGREGFGVFFSSNFTKKFGKANGYNEFVRTTENNFGMKEGGKSGKSIYQAEVQLPTAQQRVIQTGSWVIGGMPASVIFREGKKGKHFEDSDPFLLHTVRGSKAEPFKFKLTREQSLLRKKIYLGKATPTHLYSRYGGSVTYSPFAHPPVKKMGAWKDWSSYKAIEQMVHTKSTLDPKCDNICQNYLRQGYMGMTMGQASAQVIAMQHYYNFQGGRYRYQQSGFGKIARFDMSGRGLWFSVDSHGVIRTHHYSSAGFARS